LGLSGPVVGFVVTIIVTMLAMLFGPPLTQTKVDQLNAWSAACNCSGGFPASPLVIVLLGNVTSYINPNVLLEPQLAFAAQVGALLTFLNIVPAWQLDGGHISRAVLGPDGHRIATYIGLGILLIAGFWPFALLVLVMMGFSGRGFRGVEPLDDVSP